MSAAKKYYQEILDQELKRRQDLNLRYSLRSFARFLEVDSSSLSAIMSGKRILPLARAHTFAVKMGLSGDILKKFISSSEVDSIQLTKLSGLEDEEVLHSFRLEDDLDARILIYWEYFAIYAFLATCEGPVKLEAIGQRLGLEDDAVLLFLDDLILKKLVAKTSEGLFQKIGGYVHTRDLKDSFEILREGQRGNLNLLLGRLNNFNQDELVMVSTTTSMNAKKFAQVKKLITEFQKKLSKFMRSGEPGDEVYQFMGYLFPLTKSHKKEAGE